MLSYQHAYHAGNAADVHKHALLAVALDYMAQKPKPLSYIETHAGRALYDLSGAEAQKTGEAAAGIGRLEALFPPEHPYARALATARARAGPAAYPGSPLIAAHLTRPGDTLLLAERHPQEVAALRAALPGAQVQEADGPVMVLARCPPTPRRGLILIDPSYEVKTEFAATADLVAALRRKWPVGVVMLWAPILASGAEAPLAARLAQVAGDMEVSQVRYAPARPGHGLIGSTLWVANPPWGWVEAARALEAQFAAHAT